MKLLTRNFGWIIGWLLASPAVAATGLKGIAQELAAAARGAHISRVAVLPFAPAAGGESREGWNIAERLVTPLVRTRKVQAVERQMLERIMDEHHLGQTGLFEASTVRRIGKVSAAEGIVTGSYVAVGPDIVVNARLIDVETGIILAACEGEAEREGLDAAGPSSWPALNAPAIDVGVPELTVDAPPVPSEPFLELRDAPSDDPCEGVSSRIDRLENSVLDIKARYWAFRLLHGLDFSQLTVNPGSDITNPLLKHEFYERMTRWYRRGSVPELTPAEAQRFAAVSQQADSLYKMCGI